MLHGMLSELHRTEDTLKFNAMRVVADIIDRLPIRTRDLVLGILSNDIVTSSELRALLGVEDWTHHHSLKPCGSKANRLGAD